MWMCRAAIVGIIKIIVTRMTWKGFFAPPIADWWCCFSCCPFVGVVLVVVVIIVGAGVVKHELG